MHYCRVPPPPTPVPVAAIIPRPAPCALHPPSTAVFSSYDDDGGGWSGCARGAGARALRGCQKRACGWRHGRRTRREAPAPHGRTSAAATTTAAAGRCGCCRRRRAAAAASRSFGGARRSDRGFGAPARAHQRAGLHQRVGRPRDALLRAARVRVRAAPAVLSHVGPVAPPRRRRGAACWNQPGPLRHGPDGRSVRRRGARPRLAPRLRTRRREPRRPPPPPACRVRLQLRPCTPAGKPEREHPKRPIAGFATTRREVSGQRFWGWARAISGTPEARSHPARPARTTSRARSHSCARSPPRSGVLCARVRLELVSAGLDGREGGRSAAAHGQRCKQA